MRLVVSLILGLVLGANGLFMLADPGAWYALVPGVPDTGPFNAHFVRDIGCVYLVVGAAFCRFAFDEWARPAALAGAAFLTLHALVHVADAIAGRGHHVTADLVTIFAPAAVALWLGLSSPHISGEPRCSAG